MFEQKKSRKKTDVFYCASPDPDVRVFHLVRINDRNMYPGASVSYFRGVTQKLHVFVFIVVAVVAVVVVLVVVDRPRFIKTYFIDLN